LGAGAAGPSSRGKGGSWGGGGYVSYAPVPHGKGAEGQAAGGGTQGPCAVWVLISNFEFASLGAGQLAHCAEVKGTGGMVCALRIGYRREVEVGWACAS
jgi:hypothetical protein